MGGHTWNPGGDAVMIAVENHNVHPCAKDVEHETCGLLNWNFHVNERQVFFVHDPLEVFNLAQ